MDAELPEFLLATPERNAQAAKDWAARGNLIHTAAMKIDSGLRREASDETVAEFIAEHERITAAKKAGAAARRAARNNFVHPRVKARVDLENRLAGMWAYINECKAAKAAKKRAKPWTMEDHALACYEFSLKGKRAKFPPPPIPYPRGDDVYNPSAKATAKRTGRKPSETMAIVMGMLERPEGCTLVELSAATGQLTHSCSAMLSGIRKTRTIAKASEDKRGTVYRLEPLQ